ncbi:TonB-dependent receptor plug domain-containing protein [Carboxylicivirga marina]|uniref:TonB-dependent receptor plug domain-containing protein n=1 Tax=Carboxylicivirga marina TaxID=2800988 RepID=UPI0025983E31|nr:TonB-dependent receptor [uncultured Carboxylicivirga sp.]
MKKYSLYKRLLRGCVVDVTVVLRQSRYLFLMLVAMCAVRVAGQDSVRIKQTYQYSLMELSQLKTITGSIKEVEVTKSPSNITVITQKMIEDRGYQTLVDVCQDIPGFDFMLYNEGNGEYPTHNMNRGIGEVGNSEVLVMVDGIVQNNISFNWSYLWTYENMLIDIERIEIVQGPGSVVYGAQAFTGIIHLITKSNHETVVVKSFVGSDNTRGADVLIGSKLGESLHLSMAVHSMFSKGDMGLNRYDPGSYFKNHRYPAYFTTDYNYEGDMLYDQPNTSYGGKAIPEGFNTTQSSFSLRGKLHYKNSTIGVFYSDYIRAYGPTIVAYEYDLTDKENTSHYRNFHTYFNNTTDVGSKLQVHSSLVFRGTNIIPDGGFKYLYRFPNLRKSYGAYSYQAYIEERLIWDFDNNSHFSLGLKGSISRKSDRIVSLGTYPNDKNSTPSSWDEAIKEDGSLNVPKSYPLFTVNEVAVFGLWDKQWKKMSYSVGLRYDYSSEFGSILNPRMTFDYNPSEYFGVKLLYGKAFRQPSIFELSNEFRGNPNLSPQKIHTYELELRSMMLNERLSIKANTFLSEVDELIGKVSDPTSLSGERFENIDQITIAGLSVDLSWQLHKQLRYYSNYNYLVGLNKEGMYAINRTSKHKVNAGLNALFLNDRLTSDIRLNWVGKRKAPEENRWIQTYEGGYAPSYMKVNMALSYNIIPNLKLQLVVNNLLDEQFYGMGRETGSAYAEDYNFETNINPEGLIPAYHPQPGRIFLINLIWKQPTKMFNRDSEKI